MSGSSGPVTFDYAIWASVYPELSASVSEPQAQTYWNIANLYVDNSGCGFIPATLSNGTPILAPILGMVTSHLCALLAPINGVPASPLVGRIANATEGSVSVATEMEAPMAASWWNQTKYGAMAWQAMAPFRTALYIAAPQIPLAGQSYPGFRGILPFNGGFPWPR
jgi:uncharacterized protein DUF4054